MQRSSFANQSVWDLRSRTFAKPYPFLFSLFLNSLHLHSHSPTRRLSTMDPLSIVVFHNYDDLDLEFLCLVLYLQFVKSPYSRTPWWIDRWARTWRWRRWTRPQQLSQPHDEAISSFASTTLSFPTLASTTSANSFASTTSHSAYLSSFLRRQDGRW